MSYLRHFRLLMSCGLLALTACTQQIPSTPTVAPTPAASPIGGNPTSTSPVAIASPSTAPITIQSPLIGSTPTTAIPNVAPLPTPSVPAQIGDYQVIDELKQPQFMVQSQKVLKAASLPSQKVNFNARDLLVVLTSTRKYFRNQLEHDPDLQREGILGTQGVKVADVVKTLDFMVLTLQQDLKQNRSIRLQDPKFLNKNFRAIQWTALNPATPDQQQIRMTKYAVFTHPGSHTPTPEFNAGLYALKPGTDIDALRLKYTKQDVLKNIYEPKGQEFGAVEPLAYLDREGLESALMEGTVLIKFTDGTSKFFNVDRNNNIPYIKGVEPTEQKRYWYFKPVTAIKGFGQTIETKISLKPGVTFAGDVLNIGLGRIVVTENSISGKPQLHMGIIADTGGAFLPNLHQLDFLAGVFDTKADFTNYTQKLPEYTRAYILIKR
jgi:hypothetical protein